MQTFVASLDALTAFTYGELEQMYRRAELTRLPEGETAGRMLAWRGLDGGLLASALRRFARSPAFVWEGKTFTGDGGVNRVQLRGVLGRQNIFPFAMRVGASLYDGRPTIVIDYDRADNPPWMRRVHDEIREVAPGLYLGLDLWRARARSIGLVWFALDARRAG